MPRARVVTPREAAPSSRGVSALPAVLVAVALAHLALGAWPSMRAWGLADIADAPVAWAFWGLAALALVPPAGRWLARPLAALGDALTAPGRRAWAPLAAWAAVAALVVLAFDDRSYLVGDFALRLGILRRASEYGRLFPQALPLDTLLHERLAIVFARRFHADPLLYERLLGALRAGALALCGAALARALGRRGAAAGTISIAATASGALPLCTGYGKGLADLALLATAAVAAAVAIARTGRGLGLLALALALAIPVHRSAVALLPLAGMAATIALRARPPRRPRAWEIATLALPIAALAALAPRLVALLTGYDRQHLLPAGASPAGALALAFTPAHLVDVANVVLLAAPGVVAGAAALIERRGRRWTPTALVLLAAAIPFALELLFVHPRQGMVRDGDVFAPAGAVFAFAAAAVAGVALSAAPARAWLAPAFTLSTLAPIGAQLARAHDPDATLAWTRRIVAGPPARTHDELASLHEYLAISLAREQRSAEAEEEFRASTREAPTEVHMVLWLQTALTASDLAGARDALDSLAVRYPDPQRLLALGRADLATGRAAAARTAVARALALAPGDSTIRGWAARIGVPAADSATARAGAR